MLKLHDVVRAQYQDLRRICKIKQVVEKTMEAFLRQKTYHIVQQLTEPTVRQIKFDVDNIIIICRALKILHLGSNAMLECMCIIIKKIHHLCMLA